MQLVRDNGRTPLILSSIETPLTIFEIQKYQKEAAFYNPIFLRSLGLIWENGDYERIKTVKAEAQNDYFRCLEMQESWLQMIYLDEDEDESNIWTKNFDPDINMLLGKHGLPNDVWKGKDIFKSHTTCPESIKQHLEQHY